MYTIILFFSFYEFIVKIGISFKVIIQYGTSVSIYKKKYIVQVWKISLNSISILNV